VRGVYPPGWEARLYSKQGCLLLPTVKSALRLPSAPRFACFRLPATLPTMPDIVLSTLNAKYIHASFGLRYLLANLGALQPRAALLEFDINQRPLDIAEILLAQNPKIIGLGFTSGTSPKPPKSSPPSNASAPKSSLFSAARKSATRRTSKKSFSSRITSSRVKRI
jgi:hypothetical protein